MFSDPMYAAIIGAVIGFVARLVDNRMSDTKGTVLGYLKSMAFCAGLLSLWTFISSKRSTGGGVTTLMEGTVTQQDLECQVFNPVQDHHSRSLVRDTIETTSVELNERI
jgi:hypothetical protein